jgi:hypothetical protein
MNKIDDSIMHERRLERLNRLNFFMKDHKALRYVALSEAHNLLTGFFQNSHWRTAWYCLKKAAKNDWTRFTFELWYVWNKHVRGLTDEQMEAKLIGVELRRSKYSCG